MRTSDRRDEVAQQVIEDGAPHGGQAWRGWWTRHSGQHSLQVALAVLDAAEMPQTGKGDAAH